MILFYQCLVWLVIFMLVFYGVSHWIWEEKVKKASESIRKTWYLLYLLGAVIFWTIHPDSLFTEWKNYLIVFTVFILVDAFLFLGMYIKKLGVNELERHTEVLEENARLVQENNHRLKTFASLLQNVSINLYQGGLTEYMLGLNELIDSFAKKNDLSSSFHSFDTDEEKEQLLGVIERKGSIRSALERNEIVYRPEEKSALIPIEIQSVTFVLKIKASADEINEADCLLFLSLIHMYDIIY
ncbi:stage II sporulation protein SA [Bacillus sp. FJAT-42376]|uniref:type II toxin-antitoxin system SpoIISA family toxin n=1 Tax=Bacillus sp. FJAT-42376 TaxID=2014076 RepID=UPI000F4F32FA|nr:type II toxin-antitoxin system SpoIISA family toxin [Bacillus sp. FJAT-42376]AZB42727.1 stage II sporulation protein SA [Bacillus sp. FJAT-42376]